MTRLGRWTLVVGSWLLAVGDVRAQGGASNAGWVVLRGDTTGIGGTFDARRNRTIKMTTGGFEERGDADWMPASVSPPPYGSPVIRANGAWAFDASRQQVLLFGGRLASTMGDFWTWNGLDWRPVNVAVQPPRRREAAMAFDALHGIAMLHGGVDTGPLGDTWSWDGSGWTQVSASGPAGRCVLAHDAANDQWTLVSPGGPFVLQASGWVQTAAVPVILRPAALADDPVRRRVVLYLVDPVPAIMEWDGTTWTTPLLPQVSLPDPTLHFDARLGRSVLTGSNGHVLTWDGTSLVERRRPPALSPSGTSRGSFVDRQRAQVVLLSTSPVSVHVLETWIWNGDQWAPVPGAPAFSGRTGAAVTWDATRGRGVLFGGVSSQGVALADTWTFDGVAWTQQPAGGMTARTHALMAHDSARGRTVMVGGLGGVVAQQTWLFDGANWTLAAPPPRAVWSLDSVLADDPRRGRCVLLSGRQTFEWDGLAWSQVATVTQPPAVGDATMDFDATAGVLRLVDPGVASVWEFDGVDWRATPMPMPAPAASRLFREPLQGRLQLVGTAACYELGRIRPVVVREGDACGVPPSVLQLRDVPVVGHAQFGFDVVCTAASPAVVAIAETSANAPLGNGCTRRVGSVLFALGAIADSFGIASMPVPIPTVPALAGLQFIAQGVAADPSQTGGFVVTQGLRFAIGR